MNPHGAMNLFTRKNRQPKSRIDKFHNNLTKANLELAIGDLFGLNELKASERNNSTGAFIDITEKYPDKKSFDERYDSIFDEILGSMNDTVVIDETYKTDTSDMKEFVKYIKKTPMYVSKEIAGTIPDYKS